MVPKKYAPSGRISFYGERGKRISEALQYLNEVFEFRNYAELLDFLLARAVPKFYESECKRFDYLCSLYDKAEVENDGE